MVCAGIMLAIASTKGPVPNTLTGMKSLCGSKLTFWIFGSTAITGEAAKNSV